MLHRDSVGGTFLVAAVLCIVCSVAVSATAVFLKPTQDAEIKLDQQKNILAAADALPKELYLSRALAETALYALAQKLRLRHLEGELPYSRVEKPLRELLRLRQALKANVRLEGATNADERLPIIGVIHLQVSVILSQL